jgi:hypothetical protein
MKIQPIKWGIAGIAVLATAVTLVAFTGNPQSLDSASKFDQDTIPAKKRSKVTRQAGDRDFDRELRAIDKAGKELSEKDWDKMQFDFDGAMEKIDFEKIGADIDKAMKSIDFDKIQKDIKESMSKIDFEKINQEIQAAMSKVDFEKMNSDWKKAMEKVDFNKINREMEEAMKEANTDKWNSEWKEAMSKVDFEKMQKEIKESMDKVSKIDMEKMKVDMEKAQKEMQEALGKADRFNQKEFQEQMEKVTKELQELKFDWKHEGFDFKKIMENATEGIEKARVELKGFQEMVYAMEAEGLLSTDGDYTIEYNKGEISINGKKQSQAVSDKYKKYFSKDKTSIIKEDGEINIKHGSSNTRID